MIINSLHLTKLALNSSRWFSKFGQKIVYFYEGSAENKNLHSKLLSMLTYCIPIQQTLNLWHLIR